MIDKDPDRVPACVLEMRHGGRVQVFLQVVRFGAERRGDVVFVSGLRL
jgi:hypothetical protein